MDYRIGHGERLLNAETNTIKLTKVDIKHILREVISTDRADPFGEREYLLEYMDARVGNAMRGDPRLHRREIRATSKALLELVALDSAHLLLTLETQTGLVRNSMDVLEQISAQKRAALIREE